MNYPPIAPAQRLLTGPKRLYIGAYGFEDRASGWLEKQVGSIDVVSKALMFRYKNSKTTRLNRVTELKGLLKGIGSRKVSEVPYDIVFPYDIEERASKALKRAIGGVDEVVIDISSMTKLLILVCLCCLSKYNGNVRIVYSEAEVYSPSREEYVRSKDEMEFHAKFPSQGVSSIVRTRCISSVRMQGQPVAMVAFTSFNEQLIRHMLGTINPYQLIFINGTPPRDDFRWRELATQEIHKSPIEQYAEDNPKDESGFLLRRASTLDYRETIQQFEKIYQEHGQKQRIICAATGSKMQTFGLFLVKTLHQDIHIEYPTPNSYFVKGMSKGVRSVHEVIIPRYNEYLTSLKVQVIPEVPCTD